VVGSSMIAILVTAFTMRAVERWQRRGAAPEISGARPLHTEHR
jgi:hypothetical protein